MQSVTVPNWRVSSKNKKLTFQRMNGKPFAKLFYGIFVPFYK